jgi:hypothetical protein
MNTPYDTALRIAERQLDTIRTAIGLAVEELARIERAHQAAEAAMRREIVLAGDDPRLTTEHFFVRARAARARLGEDRHAAQARLEGLRVKAVDYYGSHTALDGAASGYRAADVHQAAVAEQAMLDDIAASRRPRSRAAGRLRRAGLAGSPP